MMASNASSSNGRLGHSTNTSTSDLLVFPTAPSLNKPLPPPKHFGAGAIGPSSGGYAAGSSQNGNRAATPSAAAPTAATAAAAGGSGSTASSYTNPPSAAPKTASPWIGTAPYPSATQPPPLRRNFDAPPSLPPLNTSGGHLFASPELEPPQPGFYHRRQGSSTSQTTITEEKKNKPLPALVSLSTSSLVSSSSAASSPIAASFPSLSSISLHSTMTTVASTSSSTAPMGSVLSSTTSLTSTTPLPPGSSVAPPAPLSAPSLVSNKPASSSTSLYQICVHLKERVETIPCLQLFADSCYAPVSMRNSMSSQSSVSVVQTPAARDALLVPRIDPVTFIWRFFRLGSSLCALFNILEPRTPLKDALPDDVKASKRAVYDFVQGCKAELDYNDEDLFTISNVFSDNTSDLLKVIRTVQKLIDTLESRNLLPPMLLPAEDSPEPKDKRDKVVQEILVTERKFVQDLEVLLNYQNELQQSGVLPVDTIHALFPNLSTLVDFQRRFLVGVEFNATLPPEEQRYGLLFENMEDGFEVYKGYSLNQQNACDIAMQEIPKLQAFSHLIEPSYELPAILIKPIQRICKYPLLLKELSKFTPEEWPYYQELLDGLESAKRITNNVNESQRQVENEQVLRELQERLRDWRGHNLADFGELLHEGVFPVVKTGFEREYHLYLFENIILCCKEANQSKKGMNLTKKKEKRDKHVSLVLKGRIYMAYITNVSVSKKDGYFLHISWGKDDASDTGFFDIRFRHEEALTQWEQTIRRMVARYQESAEEFYQSQLEDPVLLNSTTYDEGSDDEYAASEFNMSREQLAGGDTNGGAMFSPISDASSGTTPGGPRTMSTSSTASSSYPFPYQPASTTSSIGAMSEDLHAFKITEGSRDAPNLPHPSRSRSASTPNFTNPYPPSSARGYSDVPPLPPMPNGLAPSKASRIKSEGAYSSMAPREYLSSSSQDSSASVATRSTAPTTPTSGYKTPTPKSPQLKVKLHLHEDTFLIIVSDQIQYAQLLERIERKIRLCGKQTPSPIRIKYKDEDDDFVSINSDEDIQMALEPRPENNTLTIWVS
ncbi:hypothetical protein TRVA0_005S03906 [Trichomonascus vanleenenianus]|uniref:Rho family guanine nucleotide exchange factor CDC24 n=1 Tax=Trichomonascus vanleenenianus TaxID=2268995 RepID=UPI003EC97BFC